MSARRKNNACFLQRRFVRSLVLPVFEKTIYLFTEGATESQYIIDLASDTNVKIIAQGMISSPKQLAEKAKEFVAANKERFADGSKNSVWIVFDDDEKNTKIAEFRDAMRGGRYIKVAYMKPCIELWGVMCVKGNVSGLALTHRKIESALKKLMPGYDHSGHPYFDTKKMVHTDAACQIAAQWDRTYPTFESRMNASYFAGIHTIVEDILKAPKRHRKLRNA